MVEDFAKWWENFAKWWENIAKWWENFTKWWDPDERNLQNGGMWGSMAFLWNADLWYFDTGVRSQNAFFAEYDGEECGVRINSYSR